MNTLFDIAVPSAVLLAYISRTRGPRPSPNW